MDILEEAESFWTFLCSYSLNEKEITSHSWGLEAAPHMWLSSSALPRARSAFPVLQPPGFAPQQSDWINNGLKCCCWSYQNRSEPNTMET